MIKSTIASVLIAVTPIALTHIKITAPHADSKQIQDSGNALTQEYSTTKQEGWTCEYPQTYKADVLGENAGEVIYAKPIIDPPTKTEKCPKLEHIRVKVAT